MTAFLCPVCSKALTDQGKSCTCPAGHCFDKARQGYVNLLPPMGSGKRHGDDKLMVSARTRLLDRGFYDPLSEKISSLAAELVADGDDILDAGCGEGKYTADLLKAVTAAGKSVSVTGTDISRDALIAASRRSRQIRLAAASSGKLPFGNESIQLIVNIFSPFVREEFLRVLAPGGYILRAWPLADHLWELKELIYDRPYRNPMPDMSEEGFALLQTQEVIYSIHLENEEIMDLFRMTPYYYKTGAADQRKAAEAKSLTTRLAFGVSVYRKRDRK